MDAAIEPLAPFLGAGAHSRQEARRLLPAFLVRVSCVCGASRHIEPEALARLVGWSTTLNALTLRLRCSQCGKKAAGVVAVAKPRPREFPKYPH